jgi:hypothetical protein
MFIGLSPPMECIRFHRCAWVRKDIESVAVKVGAIHPVVIRLQLYITPKEAEAFATEVAPTIEYEKLTFDLHKKILAWLSRPWLLAYGLPG